MLDSTFWHGRNVFLTGHTGFKGGWLSLMLADLGASVHGFALAPPTDPNLFDAACIEDVMTSHEIGDVRDLDLLKKAMRRVKPDIAIHMAAQSLVGPSYDDPVGTYDINIMGTVNFLQALRETDSVRSAIVVTSDKCYANKETGARYVESDRMGGSDPYSSSKGAVELIADAWRASFFPDNAYVQHGLALATARAGNVIGGGDWSEYRLIPDISRKFIANENVIIRQPNSVRPWQHVLDPLNGYMALAEQLWKNGVAKAGGWNFGPGADSEISVAEIVEKMKHKWGNAVDWISDDVVQFEESKLLNLDASKAHTELMWRPRLDLDAALTLTVEWYKAFGQDENIAAITRSQIDYFLGKAS